MLNTLYIEDLLYGRTSHQGPSYDPKRTIFLCSACKHNATLRREHATDKVIVNPNKQEINLIVTSYNLISTKLAEQNYFGGVHPTVTVISS